jgi:hypothetical protein
MDYLLFKMLVRAGPKKPDSITISNLVGYLGRQLAQPPPVEFDDVLVTLPT